jgi:hypothetical protein
VDDYAGDPSSIGFELLEGSGLVYSLELLESLKVYS